MTYVLLHEAGHIAKHTPSGAFEEGVLNQLNIDPTKAKANEEDADEFAQTCCENSQGKRLRTIHHLKQTGL